MSVVHLAYVICDVCGAPASDPVEPGEARDFVPVEWRRQPVIRARVKRTEDRCPRHQSTEGEPR